MSNDTFTPPATPTGIDLKQINGALLLIEVTAHETGIPTSFGPSNAVRANVTVLDGPNKGEQYTDTLLFPRVLQSQLKPAVGKPAVLARLGQGTAKAGQSPPWILNNPTDDDTATARKYLAYMASQAPVSTPAPTEEKW